MIRPRLQSHFFTFILALTLASSLNAKVNSIPRIISLPQYDSATYFENKLKEAQGYANKSRAATSVNRYYRRHANFEKALEYSKLALELGLKTNDSLLIGDAYNRLATAYNRIMQIDKAMECFILAEKMFKSSPSRQLEVEINRGEMFFLSKDYSHALSYLLEAERKSSVVKDTTQEQVLDLCLGNVYYETGNLDTALIYYNRGVLLPVSDSTNEEIFLMNIGNVFADQHKLQKGLLYMRMALEFAKRHNRINSLASLYSNISQTEVEMKDLLSGSKDLGKALEYAYKTKDNRFVLISLLSKSGIDSSLGRKDAAFSDLRQYIHLDDSLHRSELYDKMSELQTKFEVQTKSNQILLLNKDNEIKAESLHKQMLVLLFVILGLLGTVLFSVILYRNVQARKKANLLLELKNNTIERQKAQVEEQHKQITDSITYAKHIQDAILPSPLFREGEVKEHFVLFAPRDGVSGDFYWRYEKGDELFFAVVDCTGHGVPGAMMSMLGIAFLNEITSTAQLLTPAEILDQLRNRIVQELRQTGRDEESKDGMDISLIRMNTETKEFHWAGANNPLYIIKNRILTEIKPNKQPVSYYPQMNPFTNHVLTLEKGTEFYLFTDGTADQFGGPNGKKMKYSHFKEVLISLYPSPIKEQKKLLNDAFNDWKGNLEQVDDVLVIGVLI